MIGATGAARVFVATRPVDFRKGADGMAALVRLPDQLIPRRLDHMCFFLDDLPHHQAVDEVAPSLRRAAVAADGLVEAVEHPEAWVVGVQWHPEDTLGDPEGLDQLVTSLLAAARP